MKIREIMSIIVALSFILSLVEFGYKIQKKPSPVVEPIAVNYVAPIVNKLSSPLLDQKVEPEGVVDCQEEPEACLN